MLKLYQFITKLEVILFIWRIYNSVFFWRTLTTHNMGFLSGIHFNIKRQFWCTLTLYCRKDKDNKSLGSDEASSSSPRTPDGKGTRRNNLLFEGKVLKPIITINNFLIGSVKRNYLTKGSRDQFGNKNYPERSKVKF